MKKLHENIDQMLPYGELIRGFSLQGSISKGELKKVLRNRGVFFKENEKDQIVPVLSTLILSPAEFETLKECQNTREDNPKKSSSKIDILSNIEIINALPSVADLQTSIDSSAANYKLTHTPRIFSDAKNSNRWTIQYEIERYDLNKCWYESKNTFLGNVIIERTSNNQLSITKSYTSSESEQVANKIQNHVVQHFKAIGFVSATANLKGILFGDFSNQQRIQFFFRLTSQMDGIYFKFEDIEDMEFGPDESYPLPEKIDWMAKKREVNVKGSDIHNTFFFREAEYHPHLQLWGIEAKFKYDFANIKGQCIVNFLFRDFLQKNNEAEFEINISNLSTDMTSLTPKQKFDLRQDLLVILETRKNELYNSFFQILNQVSAG